jgi:hypothetical protein
MTDTKQPEALRLADELLFAGRFAYESEDVAARRRINRNSQAAAELRRLHEENKSLLAANRDSTNHFDALMSDHKKLHKVNVELLAALKVLVENGGIGSEDMFDDAREAIAKAEGSGNV